jgi:hypothetical protein
MSDQASPWVTPAPNTETEMLTAAWREPPVRTTPRAPPKSRAGHADNAAAEVRGAVNLAGVVARHAPARVDLDGGRGEVPAHPQPAVAAGTVVGDGQLRLHAVAAGGHLDRIGHTGVACNVGLRRLDQVDLGAGIGCLQIGNLVRVEARNLRMVGHHHGSGYEVGEMVGAGPDRLCRRIDTDFLQHNPALGRGVVPEHPDIGVGLALGQPRPVVGQRNGDRSGKALPRRAHAIARARTKRGDRQPGIGRRQVVEPQRCDRQGGVGRARRPGSPAPRRRARSWRRCLS